MSIPDGSRPASPSAAFPGPIGVVPIVWNNVDLDDPHARIPAADVLDEITRLGFEGTQLGIGFPAGSELASALAARSLRLAEVYAAIPCNADGPLPGALDVVRGRLAELDAAGGEVLVVALDSSPERDEWVGRADSASRLTSDGWERLGELLNTAATEAHAAGHPLAFHNHGATYVETPDELARLAAITDPALVGLCLDVGHAIVGGGDPVTLLRTYRRRVTHVHLKDVAPGPLRELRDGRMTGFMAAIRARIFAPLGAGVLDLPAVLAVLARLAYAGWLMVEQDTSWEPPSEASAIGRRVLAAALRWTLPVPPPTA